MNAKRSAAAESPAAAQTEIYEDAPQVPNAAGRNATVASADQAMQSRTSATLRAASQLVAQGWRVFPLHGKKPIGELVPNGFHDATSDIAVVERWLQSHPTANLGAVPPEGCYVIDLDPHNEKAESEKLDALATRLRELGGPVQRSGGGGLHFALRGAAPSQRDLRRQHGEGIDVKAHGKGYIVVAPSVHPETGALYEWERPPTHAPAEGPPWLYNATATSVVDRDDGPLASPDSAPLPWMSLELARDVLRYLPPTAWDDYDQWLRIGFALHSQFGGSQEALDLWDAESRRSPEYEPSACAEKWATIKDDKEANYTMRSVVQEARRNGWQDPRTVAATSGALKLYNPLDAPPRQIEYVLGAPVFLPDLSEQVIFFGKSESFKSVAVQGLCVYLAAGVSLDGKAVEPRVVIYAAEEAPMLFDNNLHAWRQHFLQTLQPAVRDHARRNLEAGYLQRLDGNVEVLDERRAKEIVELVRQQQRRLDSRARPVVVLDPVAEVMGGDESKAPEMRRYIAAGRRIQRDTTALVIHVHHTGHSETDRERGSSTLPAAMFVRYQVKRESPGAYVVELHCQKHKARAKPAPSRWQVTQVELMPEASSSDPTTGVVLDLLGEAAPSVSIEQVRAEHQQEQMLIMLRAYREDPSIGGKRLRELLACGEPLLSKLQQQAVDKGWLRRGGGQGRAGLSITDAGRAQVSDSPTDVDEGEEDLLG